jgi:hypothetical protein
VFFAFQRLSIIECCSIIIAIVANTNDDTRSSLKSEISPFVLPPQTNICFMKVNSTYTEFWIIKELCFHTNLIQLRITDVLVMTTETLFVHWSLMLCHSRFVRRVNPIQLLLRLRSKFLFHIPLWVKFFHRIVISNYEKQICIVHSQV